MAKRIKSNPKPVETGYELFDVIYVDGTRRSNRRVPRAALLLSEGKDDEVARAIIEAQDQEISAKSGRTPVAVAKLLRAS